MQTLRQILVGVSVLVIFAAIVALAYYVFERRRKKRSIARMLEEHFRPTPLEDLSVAERQFSPLIRVELQPAIDEFLASLKLHSFCGMQAEMGGIGGIDLATLMEGESYRSSGKSGPPLYEHIDIGEEKPVRALKNGLWLLSQGSDHFALLVAPTCEYGECGIVQRVRVQVAGSGPAGGEFADRFFAHLEKAVLGAKSYRGKVLSLESPESYTGKASGVKVHRLGQVARDQVILSPQTLALLERNVIDFINRRAGLDAFRMATKKGLLFYGPPGTGKTHTIRFLAGSLPGHTTLLIAAEQIGQFGEYMTLARLLQPSLVVIEDVDLIARDRMRMQGCGTEVLLNKLLNEMDGLREDAQILFILTTNRPEELEAALAARPGRIDQAIEFPLPDAAGREQLVRLYSRGLELPDELVQAVVQRTDKVCAAFIKELMRRAAQFHLESNGTNTLALRDVEAALEEMLFTGGSLNLKLLGAEQRIGFEAA